MVARVVTIQAAGHRVGQVRGYYAGLAADQLDRTGDRARGPVDLTGRERCQGSISTPISSIDSSVIRSP
jgi:hypothetical protein